MIRSKRSVAGLLACMLLGSLLAIGGSAQAQASCASAAAGGGSWPSYGHDLANTRSQPEEAAIDPLGAPHLEPHWAAAIADASAEGNYQATPAVADGCVYLGTSAGWVIALNAETGETVWAEPAGEAGAIGGIFSVTVTNGRVHANVSTPDGPIAVALDQDDGSLEWSTDVLYDGPGAYTNASAVVFDGVVFSGFSGGEGDPEARGGYALIEEVTGEVLETVFAIPDEDFEQGYAGGGIWSTAAVDTDSKHAYVGAGNPFNPGRDHRHTNAILKIDLDRGSPTFGEIVDAYKGDVDQYYPPVEALTQTPLCTGEIPATIDNPQCGQLDLDFGASPNLFTDSRGNVLVGALQKSGVYHVAHADTMQKAWTAAVGAPCATCNASSSATDGESVYVVGTPGGELVSLDVDNGAYNWAAPVADGIHYQDVSVANGVVYTVDTTGRLDAFDAETGAPVNARPMSADAGDACTSLSGGVAIARGQVYAVCDIGVSGGGWVISYGYDEG